MVDNMKILYKDDELEIQSYDFMTEYNCGMADFFIYYKGIGYSCSAFCLNSIERIINQENFFGALALLLSKKLAKKV